MSGTIHQEVVFSASPSRVYQALTDGKQFGEATNAPAEIGREPGAAFSCFGGMITGRHVELVPDQRIVQAWRAGSWGAGEYSIVRFELKPEGAKTRLVFDHSGFPAAEQERLEIGWQKMYWENLQKHLA